MSGIFDDDDLWALKTHQGYPWNPCAAHVNIAAIKTSRANKRKARQRQRANKERGQANSIGGKCRGIYGSLPPTPPMPRAVSIVFSNNYG